MLLSGSVFSRRGGSVLLLSRARFACSGLSTSLPFLSRFFFLEGVVLFEEVVGYCGSVYANSAAKESGEGGDS